MCKLTFIIHIFWDITIHKATRSSPLTGHHYIKMRLIPKIIAKPCLFSFGP